MNSDVDLIKEQKVLIKALRQELANRDTHIEALKGYVEEQKHLLGEFRGQIELYEIALDAALKQPAYQPRRSRSYNANFWPRLEKHTGPLDADWRGSDNQED